jgi:hypothetical protein
MPTVRAGLTAIAATLAVLAGPLAFAPRADAYVYWTLLGGFFEPGEIGRAQNDGSHANPKFIRHGIGPVAITADAKHVFWINGDGDSIGRAKLNGKRADQQFITGVGFARDLVVARGYLYWSQGNTIDDDAGIARARANGSEVDLDFIRFTGDFTTPSELAVVGNRLYWANSYPAYTIGRARLDGSALDQSFISGGLKNPFGLAASDTHVYWTNRGTRSIARANLDGSAVKIEFIPDVGRYNSSLAIEGHHLYWAGPDNTLMRSGLGGTRTKTLIERGFKGESIFADGRGP